MFELKKILKWSDGQLLSEGDSTFQGIGSDTRKDLTGRIFIALRGDSFDAHDFLKNAIDQKAAALVIDKKDKFKELQIDGLKVTVILVNDTLEALQKIAHNYRKELGTKIVAITGSNGKTTSKEFTAQVLKSCLNVHFNVGSFNNHWGVPFSLLELKPEHQVGVIEMGMNHPHEIEALVKIADPDVVVCTMVGKAHIEHFGSVEKIAEAKKEIYEFAADKSIKIFNLDNLYTQKMYQHYGKKNESMTFTFSENIPMADVMMKVIDFSIDSLTVKGVISGEERQIKIPVFGKQNITNIMVAAAIAVSLKISPDQIWKALEGIKTNWGRNQFVTSSKGTKILFDGYNANPDSVKSLLQNFSQLKSSGKKVLVLAEMLELGSFAEELHQQIGKISAESDFDQIYFYGKSFDSFLKGYKDSTNSKAECFVYPDFNNEIIEKLKTLDAPETLICIKGSRGMKTERVVQGLVETFPSK